MINNNNKHLLATPAGPQWKKFEKEVAIRPHHGIVVPLFSLHSAASCGIGEYLDLLPLLSWCKEAGFDVIQLLPLNDTGPETSPYSALSAIALNPLHLSLQHLPEMEKSPTLMKQISELQKLTNIQRIPYKEIHQGKERILQAYYQSRLPEIKRDENYLAFKEKNSAWLAPFAFFKTHKILNQWTPWELWSPSSYPPEEISDAIEFHSFMQYLCYRQMQQVKEYAAQQGLHIKGDVPILINRESADVWSHPQLFQLQYSAGAPPDMYAKEGQKWGFPIYDWEAIAAQKYQWWIERLAYAEKFYHVYRIDHIVGFFRIWAIPLALQAIHGHFIPQDEQQWIPHGEKIMQVMLANCMMLPIGEDLGTVPPEVRLCLGRLGICGTKVMRWERHWDTDKSFIDPKDYPVESMTTVSTHDSETLQQWWENQPEEAALYAENFGLPYAPQLSTENRFAILRASHHSNSIFHINLLQEYLSLIPGMTWPLPEDERINIPGIVLERNWTYRFRPSIEEIASNAQLKKTIGEILHS